jgi:hypothetical protein
MLLCVAVVCAPVIEATPQAGSGSDNSTLNDDGTVDFDDLALFRSRFSEQSAFLNFTLLIHR